MPLHDLLFIGCIITVFTTFGLVLAWASWYCRQSRDQVLDRSAPRSVGYPNLPGLITDDD